jgi:hypothetical protein
MSTQELRNEVKTLRVEVEKWERRCNELANFNPDWDMLEATQKSLRGHMATIKEWHSVGRYIIDGVNDWTSGEVSNAVFITTDMQAKVMELLK